MNGIMTARFFDARGLPLVAATLSAIAVGFASSRSPLLTIVALAVVVLIIFVLTQPHTVLMIMLAVLPWEGMLDFPTQSLTVVKILGFLLLVSVTLTAIAQGTRLRAPPAAIAAFALVLFATISLLASHDAAAGISKLLRYALFAGFFFITIQLLDSRARLLTALKVFIRRAEPPPSGGWSHSSQVVQRLPEDRSANRTNSATCSRRCFPCASS